MERGAVLTGVAGGFSIGGGVGSTAVAATGGGVILGATIAGTVDAVWLSPLATAGGVVTAAGARGDGRLIK